MGDESWLGKTIDHYQVIDFINRGGMAEVYLAKDTKLDRPVCLKVLLPEKLQRDDVIARFKQEAQVVAKLNHPNIIRIYGIGKTQTNQPYLAIEYIGEGSLYDYLHPPLPKPEPIVPSVQALQWVKQIAEALDHAHQRGIVHRDLKPANILLRAGHSPVLADFGIAVITEVSQRITLPNQRMPGTEGYMSPEQETSQKDLDGRSDIYSLGLILYELLAGEPPKNKQADLRRTCPGLTDATYQVVDTCRQPKPAKRYQTTRELIQALDRAIMAEKMVPTRPAPPSKRQFWRHAGWAYGAGAALLLILAVAAFAFWPKDVNRAGTAVARDPSLNLNPAATLPLTVIATDSQFDVITVVASSTATQPPTDTPALSDAEVAVPPTDTPTPEPPTATRISWPTAVNRPAANCLTPTFFQTVWELRPQLGCATIPLAADFTYQTFEGGLLIWQKSPLPGIIYAIFNNGTWDQLPDPGGTAAPACPEAEQNGSLGPISSFGTVWCSTPIWQANLGNPTNSEQAGGSNQVQSFENGQIFTVDGAGGFVLYSNGRWEGFSDAAAASLTLTTPTPATCLHQPAPQWATTHYLPYQDRLGCPLIAPTTSTAAYQLFQNGLTVWSSHRSLIYVLYDAGDYAVYDASRAVDQVYSDQLKGAFGWLWMTNSTVQSRLGNPDGNENVANNFQIQEYAGGTIFYFRDNRKQTYVLLEDQNVWTASN